MISRGFKGTLPLSLLSALFALVGCSTGTSSSALHQREAVAGVLDAYAQAMKTGDYSSVPFTSDVSFVGPLTSGAFIGEAQVKEFLITVSAGVGDVRVKRQIIDGEFASVIAELETKEGTVVPFSEFFRVVDEDCRDPSLLRSSPSDPITVHNRPTDTSQSTGDRAHPPL